MQGICYRNGIPVTITEYYQSLRYFKRRLTGTNPVKTPTRTIYVIIIPQKFSSSLPLKLRTTFQTFK